MWLIPEPLVLPPLITDQQFWEAIKGRAVNDGTVKVQLGSRETARVQVRHLLDPSSRFPDKTYVDSCWSITIMVISVPENTGDALRYDKKESYCYFCSLRYHYLKIVED